MSTTTATISSALSSDPRDRLPPLRQVDIKAVDNGMVLHQTFFPQASQILTDLKSKDMIDMSSTETTEAFQKRNMKFLNVKEKKFSTAIYKRIFCASWNLLGEDSRTSSQTKIEYDTLEM
ncbi:hypothetical protein MUK42_33044 [Musa troglodytarum]|uniref:Uncharacterized protein n=1 Tax=Musa troglodytarum TaxID=320322 RepID=A0A9E7L962_9LILI|nr:hypothetical protein MUK42_33044 [Musa troglodytarum]